jgi:hypothetical protein
MFEEDIYAMLERRGLLDTEIVADSAEPRAIAKLRLLGARRIRACWKEAGWPDTGLNFMRAAKMRIVIDPRRAKKAWDEFSRYEFARYKNGDLKTGYPDADNHWIDGCLVGDTMVETAKGPIRIEELVGTEGDVIAFDVKSGRRVVVPFQNCRMTHSDAEVVRIELEDGRELRCTPHHPVLTSNRGYVPASELTAEDDVVEATGKEAEMRVKSVSRVPGRFAVYDLEVPSTHNFAVNGGVIVHNSRMGLEPDIRKAYKPKQWSLPQGYERRYAATA